MDPPRDKFVAYYRVPTQPHAKFGLGLEPQRIATMVFLVSRAGDLAGEFVEVEEAGQRHWPRLDEALEACKQEKATLFIPSLGRLVHDFHFLEGLMASGVPIDLGDLPRTNLLELHRDVARARSVADGVLERTRTALAKARAENGLQGNAVPSHQWVKERTAMREAGPRLASRSSRQVASPQ